MAGYANSTKMYAGGARVPVRGLVPHTEGSKCHKCQCFEVQPTRSLIEPWRYWCELKHSNIDPFDVVCPRKESKPREPFARWFNRRMKEEGLTKIATAKKLRRDVTSVYAWSRGAREPSSEALASIEKLLGSWKDSGEVVK